MRPRVPVLAAAALVGFAGNSLLCRLALAGHEVDAGSFTAVRLGSGALVLGVLALARAPARAVVRAGSVTSAAALFAYAAPFSFAYLRLGAALGALILFGAVQATMVGWGLWRGERPRPIVWLGLAVALAGLVTLTVPGAAAPDPAAAALMAVAGIAWGIYSLRGRASTADPLLATAANFTRALPLALALLAVTIPAGLHATPRGLVLAAASGALASGLGYTLWYAALRGLSATGAAMLQLLVPVLAAAGGVALLGEAISARLLAGGGAILAGVLLSQIARRGRA